MTHQFSLDGEDSISGRLTVVLLARNDDHLRVAVLCRQVDLSVGLLADLAALTTSVSVTSLLHLINMVGTHIETPESHLLDVGAALTNYVFMELLEDGNGEREAILDLPKKKKLL